MIRRYSTILLLALLVASFPIMAQDATPSGELSVVPVTQEAVATVEATADTTVITVPDDTDVIVIEQPPVDPVTPPADDGIKAVAVIGWIGFLLVLSTLAYVLLLLMRELRKSAASGDQNAKNLLGFVNAARDMLPVDELIKLVDRLDKRAKETPVVGEIDNAVAAQIKAYVYELLGREPPAETSQPAQPVVPPDAEESAAG